MCIHQLRSVHATSWGSCRVDDRREASKGGEERKRMGELHIQRRLQDINLLTWNSYLGISSATNNRILCSFWSRWCFHVLSYHHHNPSPHLPHESGHGCSQISEGGNHHHGQSLIVQPFPSDHDTLRFFILFPFQFTVTNHRRWKDESSSIMTAIAPVHPPSEEWKSLGFSRTTSPEPMRFSSSPHSSDGVRVPFLPEHHGLSRGITASCSYGEIRSACMIVLTGR